MKKVIGGFYYSLGHNGNLSGHYSNNLMLTPEPEKASRRAGAISDFIGTFFCEWEDGEGPASAILTIALKTGSKNIFTLHWQGEGFAFWGEGFLVDQKKEKLLIGDYRNFQSI